MGLVYKDVDTFNSLEVAVKVLHPKFQATEEKASLYLRLFEREATILTSLDHPNIVSIFDSGVEDGVVFFVMEWLQGITLGQKLLQDGKLSCESTSKVVDQICKALSVAHQKKVIHLDLKPNNIFLVNEETGNLKVKIIDFGLSRIIQSTMGSTISRVMGTPQYISPEMFMNKANHLSDVYSLGVITYEMLTGVLPFSNTQIYALVQQQLAQTPPSARLVNPAVTEYADELIRRAMSKRPSDRPTSALEFSREFSMGIKIFSKEDPDPLVRSIVPRVYLDAREIALSSRPGRPNPLFASIYIFMIMMSIFGLTIIIFPLNFPILYFPLTVRFAGYVTLSIMAFFVFFEWSNWQSQKDGQDLPTYAYALLFTLLPAIIILGPVYAFLWLLWYWVKRAPITNRMFRKWGSLMNFRKK